MIHKSARVKSPSNKRNQTGKKPAKKSAQTPSAASQTPTDARTQPPHFFIFTKSMSSASLYLSLARTMTDESMNMRNTMTIEADMKAVRAAVNPPVEKAYPARPASMGPVQPKPARR